MKNYKADNKDQLKMFCYQSVKMLSHKAKQ